MYGITRSTKVQKQNKRSVGKRGFTLVELSVVMALLAILATMTVTFTVTMRDSVDASQSEYAFLEDYSAYKEALTDALKASDVANNKFYVTGNEIKLNDHLLVDEEMTKLLRGLYEVKFEAIPETTAKLIKCTVTSNEDATRTMSFVCAIRFATIEGGGP